MRFNPPAIMYHPSMAGPWTTVRQRLRRLPAFGLFGSALLHGLLLLAAFLLSRPDSFPPTADPLAVELLDPGALDAPGPPGGNPAPPAARQAPAPAPARPVARSSPPAARPAPKPPPPVPATDDFSAMLRDLWSLRGQTNRIAGDGAMKAGPPGGHGLKDVIRAQIERHWEFDIGRYGGTDLPVGLHLLLAADGRVVKAEIVDDPRIGPLSGYRPLALSLRNAALAASPLQLPPTTGGGELVLQFNPRQVLR